MRFAQGKTTQKMTVIGDTRKTGTKITFKPDPEIFLTTREFQYEILAKRLRELAFLNPGHPIELADERSQKSDVFFFKDGITEFVRFLNQNKNVLHDKPITFSDSVPNERPGQGRDRRRRVDPVQRQLQRPGLRLRELDLQPGGRHAPLRASGRR